MVIKRAGVQLLMILLCITTPLERGGSNDPEPSINPAVFKENCDKIDKNCDGNLLVSND